jgi:flavin-binding protein dodecin
MHIQSPNCGGPMRLFWGQSPESVTAAIKCAADAARTELEGAILEWLEVAEIRGGFKDGKELQFQVAVRIGYQPKS